MPDFRPMFREWRTKIKENKIAKDILEMDISQKLDPNKLRKNVIDASKSLVDNRRQIENNLRQFAKTTVDNPIVQSYVKQVLNHKITDQVFDQLKEVPNTKFTEQVENIDRMRRDFLKPKETPSESQEDEFESAPSLLEEEEEDDINFTAANVEEATVVQEEQDVKKASEEDAEILSSAAHNVSEKAKAASAKIADFD